MVTSSALVPSRRVSGNSDRRRGRRRTGAERQRKVRSVLTRVVFALVLVVGYAAVKQLDFGFDSVEVGVASYRTDHSSRRSLLATGADWEKCSFENGSGMGGFLVLYILLVAHIFVGIAILADDFFVPSLEAISEALNLSEDVAGATFMAAGSSAPELFTSLAGVAVESDVGVGTIVGSAAFNILVIVALSGALAGAVLEIDWTAMYRDSIFYGGSIVLFIIFAWDGYLAWWEGLIEVFLYGLYIYCMKRNQDLRTWMIRKFGGNNQVSPMVECTKPVTPSDSAIGGDDDENVSDHDVSPMVPPCRAVSSVDGPMPLEDLSRRGGGLKPKHSLVARLQQEEGMGNGLQKRSSSLDADQFRKLLVKQEDKPAARPISGNSNLVSVRARALSASEGNLERADSVGSVSSEKAAFHHAHVHNISSFVSGSKRTSKTAGMKKKHGDAHPRDMHTPARSPLSSGVTIRENEPTDHGVDVSTTESENGKSDSENDDESMTCGKRCCVPCIYGEHPTLEEGEGVWGYRAKWCAFCLSAPYIWLFTNTIPPSFRPLDQPIDEESGIEATSDENSDDEDGPQTLHYFKTAFTMCIVWIMILSFIMVLFVIRLGCMIGIDDYTMGLVIVAAGTSIPDALSSVLVAQDGAGSMAVSNAIGSNVFDINLGIGIPFMLRALIDRAPVDLLDKDARGKYNDGDIIDHVKFSLILLGILIIYMVAFKITNFHLTKKLGYFLLSMYILFITYALVQELVCKRSGTLC